ncbi:MAG TPA: HAMP domain-containing sensor histidine kinase [Polyangiaceae bacterium]|nr:HAMP domain-containing sensor histidine kinase [Polyangiaceae bacterium]
MTWLVALAAAADLALLFFMLWRLYRAREEGLSLRLRIFGALAVATLVGALLTGVYAVAEEAIWAGIRPLAARIAPKAFVIGSALLLLSAAGAAEIGRRLSRPFEELTESATRIAGGELSARLPRGRGREGRRLARALASMRAELEGRPYAAAFLRDAWHDLKTPAAAIKATVEVLEDGALDDPQVARRFLANLRQSCDTLEQTLADLVTLSRFETATLAPEARLAASELVADALARVRPLADATGVRLAPPEGAEGLRVRGDREALARALGNLLENAVVASPGGSVSLSVDTPSPLELTLDVVNEPGEVPVALRQRLFQRGATSSRKGSGSGLGLAIARAAIEAHGGRVRFLELGPPRVRVRIELPR